MRRQPCRIVVDFSAWSTATTAAARQPGCETGGVLLGWRNGAGVCVSEFIEVPDLRSTRSSYLRSHAAATQRLQDLLGGLPEGSPEGYVGEWHTHLAPHGPSRTDRSHLKKISRIRRDGVALIVLAHDPASDGWEPRGLCGRSGKTHPTAVEIRPPQPGERE